MNPAVEVHNLSVAYDARPALLGISATVERGEVIGIVGPNGAGKSTFFRALLGLAAGREREQSAEGKPCQKVNLGGK